MNSKKEIKLEYLKKLNIVLDYIENNLDNKITVKELAEISNLSEFHFHRILKGALGENIGDFITRRRVETAAILIRYTKLKIKDIAFSVGYECPASLNKIFKQYYNISPTQFRNNKDFFLVKPKIKEYKVFLESPEIFIIPDKRVIYIRITGKYGNENYQKTWNNLIEYAVTNDLITRTTEYIAISYDDPKITNSDKCKYDACLTIEREIEPHGKIGIKTIKGGKYAIFTYKGAYKYLEEVYDYIFGKWLINSDFELRETPVLAKKENIASAKSEKDLIIKIYLPIF